MARILVTYGTKYGSTAEIASRIGERFTAAHFDTDVLHANLGIDIAKYDGLVVGSPIYAGQWLAEPTLILVANRERSQSIPIALFSVGTIDVKHPGKLRQEHDAWIDKAFTREGINLNIIANATFDGTYHRRNFPLWMRIADSILRITPQGDFRQWHEIERWADETAEILRRTIENTTPEDTESPLC